jgi:uncharacterized protein
MHFEQTASIPASKDRVWSLLMDVPRVAACVPGVEAVEPVADDRYAGLLKVRVGPISLNLKGEITITQRDEAAGTAEMVADAQDKRVGGAVKSTLRLTLQGSGDASTLRIETDAQVLGRIGDFGQPVIKRKADQIMQEFAANLAKAVTTPA